VYTLARAYILSGDERYVEVFWQQFEAFLDINLPNLGPNWVSAQEVGLRLIAFSFACQVFCSAEVSSAERINRLSISIADHAARIPPSLAYARAQNNNHLLSEAAGLITAGCALPTHPETQNWQNLGWRWFNRALDRQIADSGTYIQHSTNYHRLMLQLALWVSKIEAGFSSKNLERLGAATRWLLDQVDPETGRVPNLGHNDGSYIQPLSSCSYADYRPVLQAAALRFLDRKPFPGGRWDELAAWLGLLDPEQKEKLESVVPHASSLILSVPGSHVSMHSQSGDSWGYLRTARFHSRPAHADQLHLDLWWRDHNIALDAGTYSYNAETPWDNALVHTRLHNTVTIEDQDQMTHAGRFLWLDWAQAEVLSNEDQKESADFEVTGQHDGYRKLGLIHRRTVLCQPSGNWQVEDFIFNLQNHSPISQPRGQSTPGTGSTSAGEYKARLHWLLPDWSWEFEEPIENARSVLRLRAPEGWIRLLIGIESATQVVHPEIQLIRAGETLLGDVEPDPVSGWISPTYGYKIPALSLAFEVKAACPIKFSTQWQFPSLSEP
jgi:hypothetical protein